ncbi:MAG: hypothetical protein Ct9H300mP3_10880 [Gammaproteobacteria bacterium]|nr:MAG: hypothetical protein Ct9H300mP3_10880 [Gammaproteobacteria bacterium]
MKEGFQFFSYGLGHHYIFGINKPGRTNIWEDFQKNKIKTQGRSTIEQQVSPDIDAPGIGTPKELSAYLKRFEKTGVDQVTFIQQGGRNKQNIFVKHLNSLHQMSCLNLKKGKPREKGKKRKS